jgi:hypothetical protein
VIGNVFYNLGGQKLKWFVSWQNVQCWQYITLILYFICST